MNIETVCAVERCGVVADCDYLCAEVGYEVSSGRADVAEALNGECAVFYVKSELLGQRAAAEHDAASGRLGSAERTADFKRLAGDDAGDRIAVFHRICIHDPAHDFGVGVDVGSGNVLVGADDRRYHCCVASGHSLKLALGHLRRVAGYAALCAAVGNVGNCAFEGHPCGERADFVHIYIRMKSYAALARTAGARVLDAVACEHFHLAVVHAHGEVDLQLLLWITERRIVVLIDAVKRSGAVEHVQKVFIRICFFTHNFPPFRVVFVSYA